MKNIRIRLTVVCLSVLAIFMTFAVAGASPARAPEKIKAVMVGDRLVDVSLKLGVIPEGMAVRLSMWPDKADGLRVGSQVLGCPNSVIKKHPEAIANFMKERGITRIILEKSNKFCLYKKDVAPEDVADLVKNVPGVTVDYVDFTQGVQQAITETAKLLGKEKQALKVAADYKKAMQRVEQKLPKQGLARRVLVLNGNYSQSSGKVFVRIEAPGGYTDQYILNPLGCTNVAGAMLTDTMRISKGHVSGGRLKGLANTNADVIVATGNGFAVQKALHAAIQKDPSLAEMPAIKNGEIYSLPFYGDSSVLEYPAIFKQWQVALTK